MKVFRSFSNLGASTFSRSGLLESCWEIWARISTILNLNLKIKLYKASHQTKDLKHVIEVIIFISFIHRPLAVNDIRKWNDFVKSLTLFNSTLSPQWLENKWSRALLAILRGHKLLPAKMWFQNQNNRAWRLVFIPFISKYPSTLGHVYKRTERETIIFATVWSFVPWHQFRNKFSVALAPKRQEYIEKVRT